MRNFENFPRIDGLDVVMYKLRHEHFTREATIAPYKSQVGYITKKFSWETQTLDHKIHILNLIKENLHMQGDTLVLQLFLAQAAVNTAAAMAAATFIGELRFRWKHCLEDANVNNWVPEQIDITDEANKV